MTIYEIQVAVALQCGVSVLDIISQRQGRAIYRPRQVAMWLARHLTPAAIRGIGRAFGDRDHTTVLHAVQRIDHEIATGTEWGVAATTLREDLAGRMAA